VTATGRRSALGHRTQRSGNAFNPVSIGGMQLWVDSSYATVSGGIVTAMQDLSGNGRTISSPTGPTFTANDANFGGRPSMTFDGTTQYLATSSFTASGAGIASTVYTVHRCTGALAALQVIIGQAVASSGHLRINVPAAGTSVVGSFSGAASSLTSWTTAGVSLNAVVRSAFTFESTQITAQARAGYLSGAASGSRTATAAVSPTFTGGTWGIGASTTGGANWFAGQIVSVMVFAGEHSAAQVAQVDAYLKARFGQ
jgi:hypothetical protein